MKRALFTFVCRFVDFHGYIGTKEEYILEYYPEHLLLGRLFNDWRRFFRLRWWGYSIVVRLLPKSQS